MLGWLRDMFRIDREAEAIREAFELRAAQAEQLALMGYREWLAHPEEVYPLKERELEFRRIDQTNSFVAKPVDLGPAFNIAGVWWRFPELIPPSRLH